MTAREPMQGQPALTKLQNLPRLPGPPNLREQPKPKQPLQSSGKSSRRRRRRHQQRRQQQRLTSRLVEPPLPVPPPPPLPPPRAKKACTHGRSLAHIAVHVLCVQYDARGAYEQINS